MLNLNPIIRQLQIDMIIDEPNEILDWFNDRWSQLYIIETEIYHKDGNKFIYYIIEGDKKLSIFFQDKNNDKFWCNYDNYWSILESKFNLKYDDIQAITKLLVENALNNSIATPIMTTGILNTWVESALNNNVVNSIATPISYPIS